MNSHLIPVRQLRALTIARQSVIGLSLCAIAPQGLAMAQTGGPNPTVSWTASATPATAKPGSHLNLVLRGAVRDGWHLYALKQPDNGPTPLRVALDANEVATAAGSASGSVPIVAHDAAFNLDTPYYTHGFSVTVPVRLKPKLAAGRQTIPVSVRFQTCNGQTCEPPKTLHLNAAVDVGAGR